MKELRGDDVPLDGKIKVEINNGKDLVEKSILYLFFLFYLFYLFYLLYLPTSFTSFYFFYDLSFNILLFLIINKDAISGNSDPYVVFSLVEGDKKSEFFKTDVKPNTLSPGWYQSFEV